MAGTPVAAAADAVEACVRGVAPAELPIEGAMELGIVCRIIEKERDVQW